MFSFLNVLICGLAALAIWTTIGFACTARMTNRFAALGMAPIVGWAVQSVLALPLLRLTGTSPITAGLALAVPAVIACCLLFFGRRATLSLPQVDTIALTVCAAAVAAVLAAVVAPEYAGGGIVLSATTFDHTKVAIIDEIRRGGVPVVNPFVSDPAASGHLAYYYLWHFSAALLSLLTGATSWEADVGLTWFTLFASLATMLALTFQISGSRKAVWWVFPVALAGSLRLVLEELFGWDFVTFTFGYRTGFSGWVFQSAWAPQHIASAACAVIGIFVLAGLARRPRLFDSLLLGLLAAASFGSSTWIGAIVFPMAAILAAIPLLMLSADDKVGFMRCALIAGILMIVLSAPLLAVQWHVSSLRAAGFAVGLAPFDSFGGYIPDHVRTLLNPIAYWLITLPLELSVSYVAGCWALARYWRDTHKDSDRIAFLIAATALIAWSLIVGAFFVSKLGNNNDLAWRGILPASTLLIAFAAAGLGTSWRSLALPAKAAMLILFLLGFEDTRGGLASTLFRPPAESGPAFARSAGMWAAVRRASGPADRVANNPDYLQEVFPWPINPSWAFWADRRSCYANEDLVGPFSSFTDTKRKAANDLFTRLFAAQASAPDITEIKSTFDCRLVVVTPQDGLWKDDRSLITGGYGLVDSSPDWRIYRSAAH